MSDKFDTMKEVANVSTGYAATALSSFLGCGVSMTVPSATSYNVEDLPRLAVAENEEWAAIYAPVKGDVSGGMFFMATLDTAQTLASHLLHGEKGNSFATSLLARSAFQEVGNIVIGSYLTALSEMAAVRCYPLVTELSIDLAGALLAEGAFYLTEDETFLLMETKINVNELNQRLDGLLFFIPAANSVTLLTERLRKKDRD